MPSNIYIYFFLQQQNLLIWSQFEPSPTSSVSLFVLEPLHTTIILLQILQSLESKDFVLFQYHLKLQPNPITASRLENADRPRTVDLMVQQYQPEGARQATEEILRTMNFQELADNLGT